MIFGNFAGVGKYFENKKKINKKYWISASSKI